MTSLAQIAKTQPTWLLEEFVDVANQLLPHYLPTTRGNTRVREEINPRLVRHYTSLGMLDEPQKVAKYAVYIYRHLLQLLVVRRLLSEGIGANAINQLATQKSNTELETLLTEGVQLEVTPANPALAYLQQIKQELSHDLVVSRQLQVTVAPETAKRLPVKTSHWVHLEILPGLEIHIQDDFSYPNTPSEQQFLKQRIIQKLEQLINQRRKL